MRMGDHDRQAIPAISTGSLGPISRLASAACRRAVSSRSMVPSRPVRHSDAVGDCRSAEDGRHLCLRRRRARARPGLRRQAGRECRRSAGFAAGYRRTGSEITDMLVRSNAVDVIIVDSVAALVPKAEIEGEMGDAHVGLQARLMSRLCARSPATSRTPTARSSSSTRSA